MITLDAGQLSTLNGTVRGITYLIDLEFLSGTQYIALFPVPISANGQTYTGVGNVVSVAPIRESEVLSVDKMAINLSVVNTAMLAYVIGPASEYRNRAVRIYAQLLGPTWVPVEAPILRWSGVMDRVRVDRRTSKEGGSTGTIELSCLRSGLTRFRKSIGLRMTHEQQIQDYPGDLGLEYTDALISKPPPWMTKAFQKQ